MYPQCTAQILMHCSVISSYFEGLEWEKASLDIPPNVFHSILTVAWWLPRTQSSSSAPGPGSVSPPGAGRRRELPGTGSLASTKCPLEWPATCPAAGRGWRWALQVEMSQSRAEGCLGGGRKREHSTCSIQGYSRCALRNKPKSPNTAFCTSKKKLFIQAPIT